MENEPILEVRNVSKSFGRVEAVKNVSFQIKKGGEVIGLIGDNGAGKSTLIKILAGYHKKDEGEIFMNGEKVEIGSPREARNLGIETVYQNQALVESLSVARNMFLGREITKFGGTLDKEKMRKKTMEITQDMGLSIPSSETPVATLSGGERQGLAIARAMYFRANIVILDEPTTALSVKESRKVKEFVERLKSQNISVIYISHNLEKVYPVSDRILIMEDGELIEDCEKDETTVQELEDKLC